MNSHLEIKKIKKHPILDLAHVQINIPPAVTILAPGPNGREFWDCANGYVISVNGAIKIPIRKDCWIVADGNAQKCEWFKWGCDNFNGLKLFSEAVHQYSEEIGDYTFWLYPYHPDQVIEFWKKPFAVDPEFFRPTETVTGIAIDFAIRNGAKFIDFIGVDCGGGYFDDKPDSRPVYPNPLAFGSLLKEIRYFQSQGIVFKAISPCNLEI